MPKSYLNEPKPIEELAKNTTTSWTWELAVLLRYVSILVVVGINKLKEKD